METYRIWEGTRTFLPGDASGYTVTEIVAEELGWFEDVAADGMTGKEYYVYQTSDGEIVINIVRLTYKPGEANYGEIYRYSSLEEAAQSEQRYALEELRLI
jgi:hypothetical protein